MASSSFASVDRNVARRSILLEPAFDENSFKGQVFCDVPLAIILSSDLKVFLNLPKVAYPRLVKAFYEHFKTSSDDAGLVTVSVTIENVRYEFTFQDIANALGIVGYKPMKYKTKELDMINELNLRPTEGNKGKVVRESALHEEMWLLDKFLWAFVCPFMHPNIRPIYALKFWHGLYKTRNIDVPMLIVEMMEKALSGGRAKKPHKLVLSRTITAILRHLGYTISREEQKATTTEVFNYDSVANGLRVLGELHGLIEKREPKKKKTTRVEERGEEEGEGVGGDGEGNQGGGEDQGANEVDDIVMTRDQRNIRRLQSHVVTNGEWEDLEGFQLRAGEWMDNMDARMGGIESTMNEIYMMNRLAISQNLGDDRANAIFNEAKAYAESSQPRGRRRRRPNPAANPEDTPME